MYVCVCLCVCVCVLKVILFLLKKVQLELSCHPIKLRILSIHKGFHVNGITGELRYDRLKGNRKIGPPYAKSVLYI